MEQIGVNHIAAVASAAPIVERVIGFPNSFAELHHKIF